MSNSEDDPQVEPERGGVHHDNPNQEVVRPDGSGPGMPEGHGGTVTEPTPIEADSGEQGTEETPARKPRAGARKRDDDD